MVGAAFEVGARMLDSASPTPRGRRSSSPGCSSRASAPAAESVRATSVARTRHRNFDDGYAVLVLSAPESTARRPDPRPRRRQRSHPHPDATSRCNCPAHRCPRCCRRLVPASASAVTVGISDQQALDVHEPALRAAEAQGGPLHRALRRARASRPRRRDAGRLDPQRQAAKQTILISFEHSRRQRRSTTRRRRVATYTKALKAFKKEYGSQVRHLALERGQRLPGAGPHGGPAGEDLQVGHRAQARRPVLLGARKSVFPGRKIVGDRHPRRLQRRRRGQLPAQVQEVRQAARPSTGASTTTATPTAARPRAPRA